MNNFTICWITSRKESGRKWFEDSLDLEFRKAFGPNPEPAEGIKIKVIDFWANEQSAFERTGALLHKSFIAIPPKPSVWQGKYRLTKVDYFSAANARNTGLCCATGTHIVYVDDLCVLMPGWLAAVLEAVSKPNAVTCGAFRKVKNMVVENGELKSFDPHLGDKGQDMGIDTRFQHGNDHGPVACPPNWLWGYTAIPIEALLKVNGWPEEWCDGSGYEDAITGQTIAKHGYKFLYDRRMMAIEDEMLHHTQEHKMKREDPGVSPNDKSHKQLEMAARVNRFPNYFGEGFADIGALRDHIQNGGEFPIRTKPETEWFTGIALRDL